MISTVSEINKIVETIAEAMGDEITRIDGIPYFRGHVFNPHASKDDVFAAVDVILPFSYTVEIYKSNLSGLYSVKLTAWTEGSIKGKLFFGEAETPSAAVSLALVEYIKEK